MKKKFVFTGHFCLQYRKKTLGQQKECQRPAAMQLVAPQAKFLVRTIESKSWKKNYEKQQ